MDLERRTRESHPVIKRMDACRHRLNVIADQLVLVDRLLDESCSFGICGEKFGRRLSGLGGELLVGFFNASSCNSPRPLSAAKEITLLATVPQGGNGDF